MRVEFSLRENCRKKPKLEYGRHLSSLYGYRPTALLNRRNMQHFQLNQDFKIQRHGIQTEKQKYILTSS